MRNHPIGGNMNGNHRQKPGPDSQNLGPMVYARYSKDLRRFKLSSSPNDGTMKKSIQRRHETPENIVEEMLAAPGVYIPN